MTYEPAVSIPIPSGRPALSNNAPRTEVFAIALGALLMVVGSAIFMLMPSYVGYLGDVAHFAPGRLGLMSGCETWGIAAASLLAPLWSRRVSPRLACIAGTLICCAGNAASLFITDFWWLLTLRTALGVFGEGVLYALSFKVLAAVSNPDRAIGIALTVTVAFATTVLYVAPEVNRLIHGNGLILALLLANLVLVALCWRMPILTTEAAAYTRPGKNALAWLALFGQTVWFVGPGAFWAFADRIAAERGLQAQQIATALAVSTGSGMLATLLCTWIGDRFGRLLPILAATAGMAASVVLFTTLHGFAAVIADLIVFNLGWNIGSVYLFALICGLDRAGWISMLIPGFQSIGLALGPILIGGLADSFGYTVLTPGFLLGAAAAIVLLLPCLRSRKS